MAVLQPVLGNSLQWIQTWTRAYRSGGVRATSFSCPSHILHTFSAEPPHVLVQVTFCKLSRPTHNKMLVLQFF